MRSYGRLACVGARGATLVTREGILEIEAAPALRRHPTGAGDVFLASYLFSRALGLAPAEAAYAAVRASAHKLEHGSLEAARESA